MVSIFLSSRLSGGPIGYIGSPSASNAFVLPQWGGIVLLNLSPSDAKSTRLTTYDLDPVFSIFRHQLMTLLGVPPLSGFVQPDSEELVTDWQLDALLRRRALENVESTKSTLQSITRLVQQIEGMPVGPDVQGDVEDALQALEQVCYNFIFDIRDCSHASTVRHIQLPIILRHKLCTTRGMHQRLPQERFLTLACSPCFIFLQNTSTRFMHRYLLHFRLP